MSFLNLYAETPDEVRQNFETIDLIITELRSAEYSGTGSPEGVVTAPVGARYRRLDGGAGTAIYLKETGTGNTGWVGK